MLEWSIDPEQIMKAIFEFAAIQPPERRPAIAILSLRYFPKQRVFQRFCDRSKFRILECRLRRHLSSNHPIVDSDPTLSILLRFNGPIQCIDIQSACHVRRIVALLAIFRQERGYPGWWSRNKGDGKNQTNHQERQHHPNEDR